MRLVERIPGFYGFHLSCSVKVAFYLFFVPMDVIGLNQRFIKDLIEEYKKQPALWKVKSSEYKNKALKAEAYDVLIKKCKQYVHGADREFVRMKINSLRTSFRKEYKKVLNSQKTAKDPSDIYKPHLWYFDLLMFIAEQNEDDPTSGETSQYNDDNDSSDDSSVNNPNPTKYHNFSLFFFKFIQDPLASTSFKHEDITVDDEHMQDYPYDPLEDVSSTFERPKRVARTSRPPRASAPAPKVEDVFDAIGKNVAHKLRGMTQQQRIIAEKIISDVMYHGQMETLTAQSKLVVE